MNIIYIQLNSDYSSVKIMFPVGISFSSYDTIKYGGHNDPHILLDSLIGYDQNFVTTDRNFFEYIQVKYIEVKSYVLITFLFLKTNKTYLKIIYLSGY